MSFFVWSTYNYTCSCVTVFFIRELSLHVHKEYWKFYSILPAFGFMIPINYLAKKTKKIFTYSTSFIRFLFSGSNIIKAETKKKMYDEEFVFISNWGNVFFYECPCVCVCMCVTCVTCVPFDLSFCLLFQKQTNLYLIAIQTDEWLQLYYYILLSIVLHTAS